MGKLPNGTVFTFLGDRENGLAKIRVELEKNEEIEGWISEKLLKAKATEKEPTKAEVEPPKKVNQPTKRGAVPKDEAALLRREPSFQYGIYGGPNFNILSHSGGEGTYNGMGFTGGAFLGFFIDKEVTLRVEGGYSLHNGTGGDGILSFGLIDLGVAGEYKIDRFSLFLGLRYDMGIGIGNIPRTVPLETAAELSSLWTDLGAGFRFPINDFTAFVARAKYGFSFVRIPVAFQAFSVLGYLEIQG